MAKSPTQLSDANFLNPYQFSDCSITYFRAFLNRLNTYDRCASITDYILRES